MADEEQSPFNRRKGKEKVVEEASSTINPDKTLSFEISPPKALKKSLKILIDSELNPQGLAKVEVIALITARNDDTGVAATVIFQSSELNDFHCTQPISPPRGIVLDQLLVFLVYAGPDDHTISIFQLDGSPDELHFVFVTSESAPAKELKVDLMGSDAERFTSTTYFCEIPMKDTSLNEMIQHLQKEAQSDSQQVSVEVKRELAKISTIGLSWDMACNNKTSGKNHHALFKLPHLESMRIASSKSRDAVLCFPTVPRNHIMMHIFLKKIGEVVFLNKALELDTVPDENSPGGDAADASQPSGDAAETSQPGGDAAEASQRGEDAAEASQSGGDAAEASQPV